MVARNRLPGLARDAAGNVDASPARQRWEVKKKRKKR
jgi:hypothetical protein